MTTVFDTDAMRRAIERKRDGEELEADVWRAIVASPAVDDAQLAALFMASLVRGLSFSETVALTSAMAESGARLHFDAPVVADKHSTGGVGDTVSLIAVPLVAACGVPVAKLSGRALGHTGGTLDKLEAIEGYRTAVASERFVRIVEDVGCSIAAQSAELVPADKRFYALRDRTGTVPSIGLIAASIVSKKLAGGATTFVFDVKAGAGAFMKTLDDARALAQTLVDVAARFDRRARAVVTDMNEPLGPAIGTGLEIIEAREFLRGDRRDPRLAIVVEAVARGMLANAGIAEPGAALARALADGSGYERFAAMARAHGAHTDALERLTPSGDAAEAVATESGFIGSVDVVALGEIGRRLSSRDSRAGIVASARAGDAVDAGTPLARVYGASSADRAGVSAAFPVTAVRPLPPSLVAADVVAADRSTPATM